MNPPLQINDKDIIIALAALRTTASLMDVVKIPIPGLMVESNRAAYTETAAKFEEIARLRDEMRQRAVDEKKKAEDAARQKAQNPAPAKGKKGPSKIVTKGSRLASAKDLSGSP
jgi:hypothetical protein